jgi:predicted regulator of Ras-like GTPase activity (Roadblock/LC7/MglB family)
MAKKKNLTENLVAQETIITDSGLHHDDTVPDDQELEFESLLSVIQEINQRKEVIGYIVKSNTKATVDLDDPRKIIDYAALTSQTFESAEQLSSELNLGGLKTVLIEGKDIKTLCVNMGENKISVFMQKEANDKQILQEILPPME